MGLRLTGDKRQDKKVLRLAELIRSKREMQLACAEWGLPILDGADKPLCIYIEENLQKKYSYTLKRCLHYIKTFQDGGVRISEITPEWIELFQKHLIEDTELSQGSASLYSSALRRQIHLAVRDRLILNNPAEFVKNIPMPESRKRPLSFAELRRLYKIPIAGRLGAEVRKAFLFACFTGLRVSDLRGLKWNMFYERSDGMIWLFKEQKKTGRLVRVPLHKSALAILGEQKLTDTRKLLESRDPCLDSFVFPLLAATKTNTDQYLKNWGLKAGLSGVSWHTARHTMATLALEQGAELRAISDLLGHSNISTTLRYAEATDKLKRRAVESIPSL